MKGRFGRAQKAYLIRNSVGRTADRAHWYGHAKSIEIYIGAGRETHIVRIRRSDLAAYVTASKPKKLTR